MIKASELRELKKRSNLDDVLESLSKYLKNVASKTNKNDVYILARSDFGFTVEGLFEILDNETSSDNLKKALQEAGYKVGISKRYVCSGADDYSMEREYMLYIKW